MINYPASIVQVNSLMPLKEWRVLSLLNLYELSNYPAKYSAFVKMIHNLEKKNLINSFRDPRFKRKYVYLTKEGNLETGGEVKSPEISQNSLAHDSKVSEIVLELFQNNLCRNFMLEHEIDSVGMRPDAFLYGEKKEQQFQIAFELEITRKTKSKLIPKLQSYIDSDKHDLVLYYFSKQGVLDSYRNFIKKEFGSAGESKFAYALDQNLWSEELELGRVEVTYKGKTKSLYEFLS